MCFCKCWNDTIKKICKPKVCLWGTVFSGFRIQHHHVHSFRYWCLFLNTLQAWKVFKLWFQMRFKIDRCRSRMAKHILKNAVTQYQCIQNSCAPQCQYRTRSSFKNLSTDRVHYRHFCSRRIPLWQFTTA